MQIRFVTPGGQAAVLAALAIYAARSHPRSPWMPTNDLAAFVGAPGAHDPEFEAVVRSLYAAGAIRLMAAGGARGADGKTIYKAMLVPPA